MTPLKTFKKLIRNLFLLVPVLALTMPVAYGQQYSKVPNLSSDTIILETVDPFEQPASYPEDLDAFYQKNIDARSYIVVDGETDRVLAQGQGRVPYPIASMSKIIPVYLAFQAMDEGQLSMDQMIEPDPKIIEYITGNPELSNVGLVEGESYSVKDLLYAIILVSANDATSALMWELYGSEQAGVAAMGQLVEEWGISQYQFYSVSGAPNDELPEALWVPGSTISNENMMSAGDVAIVAKNLLEDYPEVTRISAASDYVFKEGTDYEAILYNHNELLPGRSYGREGINGLKSGYTPAAGLNFVATGQEQGRDIYAVAMGVFGEGMSSYWEIEILLDGLLEHPDLYQNEDLPLNIRPSLEEQAEILAGDPGSTEEASQAEGAEPAPDPAPLENNRDNFLTNMIGAFFDLFR